MESTAPALNRAVHGKYLFTDSLTKASQLLSYPTENKNKIMVSEIKTTFRDVFQKINANKPEYQLIIILITFLTLATILMISAPAIILCLTRGGLVNAQQSQHGANLGYGKRKLPNNVVPKSDLNLLKM